MMKGRYKHMVLLLNLLNGLIRLAFWLFFCPVTVFASVIMVDRGYSTTMIGFIIASASIFAIFVQSVLANYADKHQNVTTMKLCVYTLLASLPLYTALLFLLRVSLLQTIIFIIVISFGNALHPFVNNFTFKLAETGYKIYFEASLFVGAIGFSLVSSLAGFVNNAYGTNATIILMICGLLIFVVTLLIGDRVIKKYAKAPAEHEEKKEEEQVSYAQFIDHNKLFVIAAIGLAFAGWFDNFFYAFTIQVVRNVGGNSADVGNIMSFASLCQLPAYFYIPFLKRKFKYSHLILLAASMFVVKGFIIYFSATLTGIYLSGLTRMLNYSLMSATIVPFVNSIMPRNEANRGQTLYTIMGLLSNVIATSLGGAMIDGLGIKSAMVVVLIVSVAGLCLAMPTMLMVSKKYETEKISG